MRFGIEQQQQQQQVKKKRGRPRKYAPDGSIGLALAPTSPLPSASNSYGAGNDGAGDSGGGANSTDPPAKRNRGRPPGSGKKQLNALGTCLKLGSVFFDQIKDHSFTLLGFVCMSRRNRRSRVYTACY